MLNDVAHRLMTFEAMTMLAWPTTSLAACLRKHHSEIPKLKLFRQALAEIPSFGISVLPVTQSWIDSAAALSQQSELLMGDSLVVAVMRAHGLTNLASTDRDFDRVPGITRYGPA